MGQGQVADQSGTSWCPVITASSFKWQFELCVLLIMEHTSIQSTPHKTTQTPHTKSPGKCLQSLIAPSLVDMFLMQINQLKYNTSDIYITLAVTNCTLYSRQQLLLFHVIFFNPLL